MRQVFNKQMQIGEMAIGKIKLDDKSRDDIPQLLLGLQYIYTTPEVRKPIFTLLEEMVPYNDDDEKADTNTGRPGMNQWQIFVLGALRLGLNTNYDRLQELANQHQTIRQMLGHSSLLDDKQYKLQTLKDNLKLFTPELLDKINQEVVRAGHKALKKSPKMR